MTDPLTAGAIAALAFTTTIEKLSESLAQVALEKVTEKLKALKQLIRKKFEDKPKVENIISQAEHGSQAAVDRVTTYIAIGMDRDKVFAESLQALAQEIQQEINVAQIRGENVLNVYDGEAYQVNNPSGPVIQGVQGDVNITL